MAAYVNGFLGSVLRRLFDHLGADSAVYSGSQTGITLKVFGVSALGVSWVEGRVCGLGCCGSGMGFGASGLGFGVFWS